MSSTRSSDPIVLSAARWFWWIAGFSLVNTVLFFSGTRTSFMLGLGVTTLANAIFANQLAVALVVAGVAAAFFFAIGVQAQRERAWAFYVGLVAYILDAFIFVTYEDWGPVIVHAIAIFYISKGLVQLREREAPAAAAQA
ncbi:MAG: hypothetical protein JO006_20750 [Paucibacter sp.]|nr:hypothetical protein [Roseateles sp.]